MQGSVETRGDLIGDLDPADPRATADDDRIIITREQWDEMMTAQREESARNRALMEQLLNPLNNASQAAPELPPVAIDIDGLPDPAFDKDGFLKGLGARMSDTVKQIEARVTAKADQTVRSAQTAQQKIDEAWALIQQEFPETAEHPDLVDAFSRRWADQQRARGVDPIVALQRDTVGVAHEVGNFVMDQLNAIRGDKEPATPANRTAGIPSSRPRSPARPTEPEPRGLIDDLKDFQSRARIY